MENNHFFFSNFLQYFKDNPDHSNPSYSTKNGIYEEGCGLENVVMSWGHDDYMYLVCLIKSSSELETFFLVYFLWHLMVNEVLIYL